MAEVNQARDYGVRILPTTARPGQEYWRVVTVAHLTPNQNRGRHNVFVDVLDAQGNKMRNAALRIAYTWEGRRADEPAPPQPLDKPDGEPAGNLVIGKGQVIRLWLADERRPSDAVEGIHTNHADELGPNGEIWNSIGHHSFYVQFQLTKAIGVDGGEGTGNGGGNGGSAPPNGDLIAMVQALQLEVAELRRWQRQWDLFFRNMVGEL